MNPSPIKMKILRYVRDYRNRACFSPSIEEIGYVFGLHKVTVFEHIEALVGAGLMTKEKHKARSIRLTKKAYRLLEPITCPNCGHAMKSRKM